MSTRALNISCILMTFVIAVIGYFFPDAATPLAWIGIGITFLVSIQVIILLVTGVRNNYIWTTLATLILILIMYALYLIPAPVKPVIPFPYPSSL